MGSASNEEREVRAARNQALFRAVNEKIVELNQALGEIEGAVSIACECSQVECVRLLEIAPDAYRAVRESPRTFAVLPEHVEAGVERVVSNHDGYVVVEVEGQGVPVAEATFATDGQRLPTDSAPEAARKWRGRVAEAAGRAADGLAEDDDPNRREMHADLRSLETRITDDQPPVADDPRGDVE